LSEQRVTRHKFCPTASRIKARCDAARIKPHHITWKSDGITKYKSVYWVKLCDLVRKLHMRPELKTEKKDIFNLSQHLTQKNVLYYLKQVKRNSSALGRD
jgi:hypothetical protein